MTLQETVVFLRRLGVRRGWTPLLQLAAHSSRSLQNYRVSLSDGSRLIVDLRDRMSYSYFYSGGLPHEGRTEELLRRLIQTGWGCLDVGANIGHYSRMFASAVGDGGSVIAVEPVEENLRLLRKNVEEFSCVTIAPFAAGRTEGTATFHLHRSGDQGSLKPVPSKGTRIVAVRTLDEIAGGMKTCDLVKIDVEGAEFDVLEGARGLLREHKPALLFEYIQETVDRLVLPGIAETERILTESYGAPAEVRRVGRGEELLVPATADGGDYLFCAPAASPCWGRLGNA